LDRKGKERELASLKEKMIRAKQLIIADHTGINVADLTALRRKLKAARSEFRVSKNTLMRLAVRGTIQQGLEEHFVGPTAIIFGYDDPASPAKIVYGAIKETEKPRFKAYFVDGRVYGLSEMRKIAELPPREVLLGIVISTVQGPITQVIAMLEAATREFVGTIDALAKLRHG
jgi:large subunit ribosomal protein L10